MQKHVNINNILRAVTRLPCAGVDDMTVTPDKE